MKRMILKNFQVFNLWSCTTRRMSLFRHSFRNWTLHFAVLLEVCALLIFVFFPGMNAFIGMQPPPGFIWCFPFIVGILLLVLGEVTKQELGKKSSKQIFQVRKYFIRKMPRHPVVRFFKWQSEVVQNYVKKRCSFYEILLPMQ